MSTDKISLFYNCFGKTIKVSNKSNILEPRDIMDMFKTIYVAEFGEDSWEQMICSLAFDTH
jgi:hypothetical protein